MAPFPETEIMTIKRLEVALRKLDFKLLKDGAYKLHEKYHSGFKFEYLDLLKEILATAQNTPSMPGDIKNVLVPTIQDILSDTPVDENEEESYEPNRVSSLTSLSYSTKHEADLKLQVEMQKNIQSPFSAQPFKEFSTPKVVVNNPAPSSAPVDEKQEESQEATVEEVKTKIKQIAFCLIDKEVNFNLEKNEDTPVKDLILDYNFSDLSKIKGILSYLKEKKSKGDLITNSINPLLSEISSVNLIPLNGLMNLFKCKKCGATYLNNDLSMTPLALQCSNCKGVMLLENKFNLDNYNFANISLVEADVWVLINFDLDNKLMINMIKAALKMNKTLEEIFILDDNISIKENFKQALEEIKADVKITTRNNDIEEFLSSID